MKTKNNFKLTAVTALAAFVMCALFNSTAVAQQAKAKKSSATEKQIAPAAEKKTAATAKPAEQNKTVAPATTSENAAPKTLQVSPSAAKPIHEEVILDPEPVTPKKD